MGKGYGWRRGGEKRGCGYGVGGDDVSGEGKGRG